MKTKPIGCLLALQDEFKTLRALDERNQKQFSGGSAEPKLTKAQIHLLTEAVFFAAFRTYENFLRNVFLLYCCGMQSSRRKLVRSFLQPKTIQHAEMLVKSSMPFLDWSSPDRLIERAEAYLKDGYPIKTSLTTNLESLRALKKIRNHISHMSSESTAEFKKVVKIHYGTLPLRLPQSGEYLLLPCKEDSTTYYLKHFMDLMEKVAVEVT
jgi:hypothetical protein